MNQKIDVKKLLESFRPLKPYMPMLAVICAAIGITGFEVPGVNLDQQEWLMTGLLVVLLGREMDK